MPVTLRQNHGLSGSGQGGHTEAVNPLKLETLQALSIPILS